MGIGEAISVVLLTLVLLNLRRTAWPGVYQDSKNLSAFFRQNTTQEALAAFARIVLTAALPAYIAFLIFSLVAEFLPAGLG